MQIRKATIGDLEAIQELNLLLFKKEVVDYDDTLNIEWTFSDNGIKYYENKILGQDSFAVVAEEQGRIIGYLVGGIVETHSYRTVKKAAELENMFVLEGYRNKGTGKKLVDKFIAWCKDNGVQRVKVIAFAGNEQAIKFYRREGFKDRVLSLEREL